MDINLTAPVNFYGYGIVGANLFYSLSDLGHNVALWALPSPQHIQADESRHSLIKEGIENQSTYNVNAPSIRHFHQFDLAQHIGKGPHIGSTVFELNRFSNKEIHELSCQDALCIPTEWAKLILEENGINRPTLILPHGVDRSIFHENVESENRSSDTVFLNCGKWELRKGHDILVDAFNKAFSRKDRVKLVMSCHNPFYSKEENDSWKDLYKNSNLGDKIEVLEKRLDTQQEIAKMMAGADCGVFPSRAEGWGLPSFEMMSMGKHVILTDYAGHTGYANNENALLISPGPLEDAYDGKWFYGQGQWASLENEQLDQLVEHMRRIHNKKQTGELNMNTAGIEVAKQLSWENAASKLIDFIKEL